MMLHPPPPQYGVKEARDITCLQQSNDMIHGGGKGMVQLYVHDAGERGKLQDT